MPRVNVGILLDEFQVYNPIDYGHLSTPDRRELIRRIQDSVYADTEDVLERIRQEKARLKMHFRVQRNLIGSWTNLPNETFAKKIAFFASKTVISFPFNEVGFWRNEDIQALLKMLCAVRPFLKEEFVYIVSAPKNYGGLFSRDSFDQKYDLVPANFRKEELAVQFAEENTKLFHDLNIYLPCFSKLDPEQIIRIRSQEKQLYIKLEERLHRLFRGQTQYVSETALLDELKEIDREVKEIGRTLESLKKEIISHGVKSAIAVVEKISIGLLSLNLPGMWPLLPELLHSVFGGDEFAKDNIKGLFSAQKALSETKHTDCFLMWKLLKS